MKIIITEEQLNNVLNTENKKRFVINKNKLQIFLDNTLVSESGFQIIEPDEWFNEKYVIIFNLKTNKKFQGKGFAKYLLNQIFKYVKNKLNINIITLIVYKDNRKAINLYLNNGFEIFMEYDDSYSLIKKL